MQSRADGMPTVGWPPAVLATDAALAAINASVAARRSDDEAAAALLRKRHPSPIT